MSSTKVICFACDGVNSAGASVCAHCGSVLSSSRSQEKEAVATHLASGFLLHRRYHILDVIGRGGMGTVYKAKDMSLWQRPVAVKEMNVPNVGTKEELNAATQAFEQEAELLAKLDHRYLPSIYDHFNDGSHWYLVMKYIEGTTLIDHLRGMPDRHLTPKKALNIGLMLCDVLVYLHTQDPSIVFGDLKPSNIMLTPTDDIYLIDFGIARIFQARQVNERRFVSPGYSPPEQYKNSNISPRSDIYSLGATLHHLLSGQPPNPNDFHFAPLQLGNFLWANELQGFLTSMLERDEQKRPEDVRVVRQELQRIAGLQAQEQDKQGAYDSSLWSRLWNDQFQTFYESSSDYLTIPDYSTIPEYNTSLPVSPTYYISPSVTYRDIELPSSITYNDIFDFARSFAWSTDGSYLAVASITMREKDQPYPKVQIYALPSEKNLLPSESEPLTELRSWSLNWNTHADPSIVTDNHDPDARTRSGRIHTEIAWSPDGTRLALVAQRSSNESIFCILKIDSDSSPTILSKEPHDIEHIKWSPDGRLIASAIYNNLLIWDTEKEIMLFTYNVYRIAVLSWSPNSRFIAFGNNIDSYDINTTDVEYKIHVWEAMTGREVCAYHKHLAPLRDIAWSPDGTCIVSCGVDRAIHVWEAQTARHLRSLEGHIETVIHILFLSNGLLLASITWDEVLIWRTDTWLQVESFNTNTNSYNVFPILHPTGALITESPQRSHKLRMWEFDVARLLGQPAKVSGLQYTNAKVVLVGDSGVGKSGLGLVLSRQPFVPTESTHGRKVWTFARRERRLDSDGKELREILLWDLAGQTGYRLIHQLHLSAVAVALVVFDAHSETDPFAGIAHWVRALRTSQRVGGNTWGLKMLLVHARVDRGGKRVSRGRIDELVATLGFDGYFETSAKEGTNIVELAEAISRAIEWDQLPKVTSTELFQQIKTFLIKEKETGHLLSTRDDLYRAFYQTQVPGDEQRDVSAEFATCIRLLEAEGLIRQLSFGDLVLLQPELLDAYASALINAVREEPDGLGSILEEDVRARNFFIPGNERIANGEQEKLLLIAMVEDLLSYEIALREQSTDGAYLIFPSESTRENPSLPDPENRVVIFTFEGPVLNVYATLAIRLSHSEIFTKQDLWKNAITYRARIGGMCGMFLRVIEDGKSELTLFFDGDASEETRFHFEEYVHAHLQRKALRESIQRRRIFRCDGCGYPANDELVRMRTARGFNWFKCPVCGKRILLVDREERLKAAMPSRVPEMDRAADVERARATAQSTIQGKQKTSDFDVFLCYNRANREAVMGIGERLKEEGLLPWLDEWEVRPGVLWQTQLERQIRQVKSAAVFIGVDSPGPWQEMEVRALLSQFVDRGCPVIPVLLESAPRKPKLPLFLREMPWVDFREPESGPFQRLVWGITGKKQFL